MPISPIVLQRRHAELGRIRLGYQTPITKKNGDPGTTPAKLSAFRLTSPSERYIRDLATLYGGEARQWDNNGKPEWEVYTETDSVPVIAVKGGLSQWMETWSGGGCVHRCDGERTVDGTFCESDTTTVREKVDGQWVEVRAHDAAKPTTRLSVMLPELEAIGVWRMESHGWNAAAEIPAVAELAQYVGDLVPAHLHLVERRVIKDGKTSRFVVPVLDLQIGTARLKQIVAEMTGAAAAISWHGDDKPQLESSNGIPAIEAPRPDYLAEAQSATTADEVMGVWQRAKDAGHMTDDLHRQIGDIGRALKANGQPSTQVPTVQRPADTDLDPDVVWQQIMTAAGEQGMTTSQLRDHFKARAGVAAEEASAAELAHYLEQMKAGVAA